MIAVRQETLRDSGPRRHAPKDNSRVRPGSGAGAQWWYDRVAEDQEDIAPLWFTRVLSYRPDSRWPRKTHRDDQDAGSGGSVSAMLAVVDAPCDAKASKIGGRGAAGGMPRMAVRAAERNRAGWNSRAGAAIR